MTARRRRRIGAFSTALALIATGTAPVAASADDVDPPHPPGPTDGLVAWYPLDEGTGTTVGDASGHGRDGVVEGETAWDPDGGFAFSGGGAGSGNAVRLPDDLVSGLDAITVAFEVLVHPEFTADAHFVLNLGNTAVGTPQSGDGYLMLETIPLRAAVTAAAWSAESGNVTSKGSNLAKGVRKHVAYTQTGSTGVLYEDGVEVARTTTVSVTPGEIGGGRTTHNYLGRSAYADDASFRGTLRDVRIYDHALPAAELGAIAEPVAAANAEADASAIDLGDTSAVVGDLDLPTAGPAGSAITWASSDPAVVSTDGRVTRPATGAGDATVALTATVRVGAVERIREITVTILAEPDDETRVAQDLAAVTIPHLDDVRGAVTLPEHGAQGSQLTWRSADPAVITTTGEVSRPAAGSAPVTVDLTVTARYGAAEANRTLTATVLPLPEHEDPAAYLFASFAGESTPDGEAIYLAASRGDDPLHWQDVNDGRPVLTSSYGEQGLRDPFLIRSPEGDRFYLLATDLKIHGGNSFAVAQQTGSRYLEIWESTDLVTWSEQRHVLVSGPEAGNTWAPKAFWDEELGAYVVYWASNLYGDTPPEDRRARDSYNRMMYATTRDFVTFSEPREWIDVRRGAGLGMIDSTVIREGDTFYRFTKDEAHMQVRQERSTDLLATVSGSLPTVDEPSGWSLVAERIGYGQPNGWGGTFTAAEGPTVFKSNTEDKWYLFMDQPSYHGGQGYVPFETTDLDGGEWTRSEDASLPTSPRHGTVLPVTQREYDRVLAAYQPDVYVADIEPVSVRTPVGVAPELPATVTVRYGDGRVVPVPVIWDEINSEAYAAPGAFAVEGDVAPGAARARADVVVEASPGPGEPGEPGPGPEPASELSPAPTPVLPGPGGPAGPVGAGDPAPSGVSGGLAATGTSAGWWLAIAALLVGTGAAVVARARAARSGG
jgi:hypothetical protein